MATPSEKLAAALEELKSLQDKGVVAIKSEMLSRTNRERLIKRRFIEEVYKGWYVAIAPNSTPGSTVGWYSNYWGFCSQNLRDRFGEEWSVTAEQSIQLHAGNTSIPQELLVRNENTSFVKIQFPHSTTLVLLKATVPKTNDREKLNGINVYKLPLALVQSSEVMYKTNPIDMITALSLIKGSSELLEHLLEDGKSVVAGRLAGAFRKISRDSIADDIVKSMKAADYQVREYDPFEINIPKLTYQRPRSPYEQRIKTMWMSMREKIIEVFPSSPGLPESATEYIASVKDLFLTDAYHSLSIEKYTVTPELIDKIRSGVWNPDTDENDINQRNAMAAKGYWEAFQSILISLEKILKGENAGLVADNDHGDWYRELFSPSISAGILKPMDLAGYRNKQVFLDGSFHTPLNNEAVRDTMPTLFELLQGEPEASVRAVLGHFIFVYIHPYIDGNGRLGRFMMNLMLASGGYPWTVIPVEYRREYMSSLEKASVESNIKPFANFIANLVNKGLQGTPIAKVS